MLPLSFMSSDPLQMDSQTVPTTVSSLVPVAEPSCSSGVAERARERDDVIASGSSGLHAPASGIASCVICGGKRIKDRKYYGAPVCDACKSFFRRVGSRKKPLRCTGGARNCELNHTKKMCPGCRLDRCLALNMRLPVPRVVAENSAVAPVGQEPVPGPSASYSSPSPLFIVSTTQ